MRIEELSQSATSLKPDIVTARALAPLPQLLELAAPWLRSEARGLLLKGRDAGGRSSPPNGGSLHLSSASKHDGGGTTFILEISHLAKRVKAKTR